MILKKTKLKLATPYGYFNDEQEYVILRPDTPKPWINYLSNREYHALVSQTGGGFSYYKDSKCHRILHWEDHKSDRPGRYLFIRDPKTNDVWTPNWQPLRKRLEQWQAKHGFGYSSIFSVEKGVETQLTYFVPPQDPCEIWVVTLRNLKDHDRNVSLFPYVHWLCGDYYLERDYKNILTLYNEAYYDETLQAIVAFKHPTSSRHFETYGFFASSVEPSGYELNYEKFVGKYGSLSDPRMLRKGESCSNEPLRGEEMIGVMEIPIHFRARQELTIVFVLGFTENKNQISEIIKRNIKPMDAKQHLQKTKVFWKHKLDSIKVETPDSEFDLMTNKWGKYQLLQITRWRSASYYSPGEGGRGFRDTAQDVEGAISIDPYLSREWLEKLLTYQYQSGHAVAGFSEIEGPWEIGTDKGILGKSDVAVWIPFMVSAYLKETGERSFLDLEIPYLDQGKGTVWEHCVKAMDHFWESRGEKGLPLFWKAEWNDALDRCGIKGKGESPWLAMAYCRALLQVEELAHFIGDETQAQVMRERYDEMKKNINEKAWDGDWYTGIFTDEGKVLGSKTCEEGKIYLNPQSWAVLSQVAPEIRAARCLKSVEAYLDTKFGPALHWPPYESYDPTVGRITAFAPGTKENAAIFSHAAAFLVVAYAMQKKGKKAYELFSKIAPYNPEKTLQIYQTEPYVYAEYCYGLGNPRLGLGAFNWNTGTAAWMFMAATQWIVGVRPTFEGLMIDPCVPSEWESFLIQRPFRGAVYEIHFKNPNRVESGVKEIFVDGKRIEGNILPVLAPGKVYKIEVVMGSV